jgi:ABC-type nitrate/sulfonate/bicarbonate transport system substrate-binding protein
MMHRSHEKVVSSGGRGDRIGVSRRRFLWGLGATGLLATRASAAGSAPFKLDASKLDLYGTRDPQLMALPSLAEVSGYFKDEGLSVTRHFVASAGELPNMLASGNIGIGCGGVTTLMILNGQGIPVYGIVPQGDISGTQALVLGRKLAGTTDPKALNGVKVGHSQGNSPIEVWTGLSTELGVDRNSVTIFNLKPPELVVALEKGDIDVMASFQPYIYRATTAGAKLIATGNRSYWPGREGPRNWVRSNSIVAVTKAMLEKSPNALSALGRALTRAAKDIQADMPGAAQKLAPELRIEPEVLLPLMKFNAYTTDFDETLEASFKFTNAWMLREGRITKPVDPKTVLVTSILEKVDPGLVKWRP